MLLIILVLVPRDLWHYFSFFLLSVAFKYIFYILLRSIFFLQCQCIISSNWNSFSLQIFYIMYGDAGVCVLFSYFLFVPFHSNLFMLWSFSLFLPFFLSPQHIFTIVNASHFKNRFALFLLFLLLFFSSFVYLMYQVTHKICVERYTIFIYYYYYSLCCCCLVWCCCFLRWKNAEKCNPSVSYNNNFLYLFFLFTRYFICLCSLTYYAISCCLFIFELHTLNT